MLSSGRQDAPTGLPEADPGPVCTGCCCGEDDLVAVLEEDPSLARDIDRFGTPPGQFDEGAALLLSRSGDRARGEQVTDACRCAVHRWALRLE